MQSPQPTVRLLEWSFPAIIGMGLGLIAVAAVTKRPGAIALWAGAIGGTAAGLALGTSVFPAQVSNP